MLEVIWYKHCLCYFYYFILLRRYLHKKAQMIEAGTVVTLYEVKSVQ